MTRTVIRKVIIMYKNICIICTKECTLFDLRRGLKNIIKNGQKFDVNYRARFKFDDQRSRELYGLFDPMFNDANQSHRRFIIKHDVFTDSFKIIK